MHKVISIHLVGQVTPYWVHEEAYEALRSYLDHARSRLADDPDQAEVMGDLERSIGAKLTDRRGPEDRIITLADVTVVLDEVGSVGADDGAPAAVAAVGPRRRRLYRITEGQEIAGICTGLAAYSEIRLDLIRWIFALLAIFSGGIFALVYFVVAVVLPVVPTREAWIARMEADQGR